MFFSFNNDTNELCLDGFANVFNEQKGIEILLKINRLIYEYLHLKTKKEDIRIKLDSYNNENYCGILNEAGIIFESRYGSFFISASDVVNYRTEICTLLNNKYGVSVLDFSKIDPMFLEQVLGIDLPNLLKAEMKIMQLNNLRVFSENNILGDNIYDGRYYKQIVSGVFVNSPNHKNNYYLETNEQRFKRIIVNMQNNSYSTNGQFLTLYNDSPIIRDGEHRASALLYLYGNIEIPVMNLYFSKNYYSYRLYYTEASRQ